MNTPLPGTPSETTSPAPDDRLSSWKAIAAYVKRDITTVQRWEKREGMPIHRHLHDKRGSVYAFRRELDGWFRQRRAQLDSDERGRRERRVRLRRWLIVGVAVALVAAVLGTLWLRERDTPSTDQLEAAQVVPLTDFDGLEQGAAISRDGRFAAFVSDREGRPDVWVTQIGTGEFRNLTQGQVPELFNPDLRSVAFTPDGALVTFWTRVAAPERGAPAVSMWAVPTIGGTPRQYRSGAAEMDWSSDGKRAVFHTTDAGDPTFVLGPDQQEAPQIWIGTKGLHGHFQIWSPDDAYIYFTQGIPPDNMDLWRMKADGTGAEQLTFHQSRVLYPAFTGPRTLLYLATTDDGAGPWIYALDVERRESRRISFGVEQYTSLAASADGKRLVATVERTRTSLWRVSIGDDIAGETRAARIDVPTVGGFAPRAGPGYILYSSPKGTGYAIWKLTGGAATELWSAPHARLAGGAAISPDGKQIAFVDESSQGTRLHVMTADAPVVRRLAQSLEVRGTPAWSPDGRFITVAALHGKGRRLYNVPSDGDAPVALLDVPYASDPNWSSDGTLLVYSDANVGTTFALKAVNADGTPHKLPPITLPRASKRISFVPGRRALIVLQGEMRHVNFWHVDLDTGRQRQLTDFGREFTIGDFDVTAAGEILFDRRRDNSDIALIERQGSSSK